MIIVFNDYFIVEYIEWCLFMKVKLVKVLFKSIMEINLEVMGIYGYRYKILFVIIELKFIFRLFFVEVLKRFGFGFICDKVNIIVFLFNMLKVVIMVI